MTTKKILSKIKEKKIPLLDKIKSSPPLGNFKKFSFDYSDPWELLK